MLSLVELTASVAPAKVKPSVDPLPVWNGAVPVQVGVNPFQSMQPAVSIARLPSASSKPEASAIVPSAPQPVIDAASNRLEAPRDGKSEWPAPESEEELLEREC